MSLAGGLLHFLFIFSVESFNLDLNFPIVYEDPWKQLHPKESTYFGYSVVLYPGNRGNPPWILTGAPRGRDSRKNISSGVCFKCGIRQPCSPFHVESGFKPESLASREKLDSAWIGGSMDISFDSERIVVCAPRWIKVKTYKGKDDDYRMQGACYWFHANDRNTQKLRPLFETGSTNYDIYSSGGGAVYYFGQGQAGFSVHMAQRNREMVLGAPGVFNWDGTAILYKDDDETTPIPVASKVVADRPRRRRDAESSEFNYKNIANAINTTQTLAYDLLGYSTTSGYFFNKSELLYVSSAPRSDYNGQILIYQFDKNNLAALIVRETKYGDQFGEYFGGSLAAGDVNGDQRDDLIVGAPFHTTRRYNEGKVYIFLGSRSGRLQTPKRDSITGKSPHGQFGTTVQYLGDINHDGFGDVAVAAPFEEEESGVVYIFKGSSDGLDTTYCQRIVGKDIYNSIRGFGISISRPADMDLNKYPDIAIGAYKSGHVVVLRSRPVVKIYQKLRPWSSHLDFKAKRFEVEACFMYKTDEPDAGNNIRIERTLSIDQQLGRAYLESGPTTKEIVFTQVQFCENFTVGLSASFSNHYDPISVSLTHKFLAEPEEKQVSFIDSSVKGEDMFCPRCPVYDKYNSLADTTVKVPFALGCKSGNICRASLEIKPRVTNLIDNTFVLGSAEYITLKTDVENTGEKAYLTQLLVTVPEMVTFRSTPSACSAKNLSSYSCSVDNPLEPNSQKLVVLELDMTTVNTGKFDESLTFTFEVLTSSENDKNPVKNLTLKLKREADVTISGKSEKQSYSYRNITQGKPNFTQIYQVEKFGKSPLNEILIEINIPHTIRTGNSSDIIFLSVFPPAASLANQGIVCTSNFSYLIEDNSISDNVDSDVVDDATLATKEVAKRSVKDVEVFSNKTSVRRGRLTKENEFDVFQNRTYYINCTTEQIICSKVVCSAGPFKTGQVAKIKLKMMLDVSSIKDLLGKKDVLLFATQAWVTVTNPQNFIQSGDKPDSANVASLFVGDAPSEKVELWIIIVAAVAGLLLLLLVILGLIKAGFFKRARKEELEQLKKEMECQENLNEPQTTNDAETEE